MKYRKLTVEELEELKDAFVGFLASNQVTAEDWKKYKSSDQEKVDGLIELFSDMIFEDTLQKVKYLEYKEPNDIKTFHFEGEKVVMNGLFVEGESDLDFTAAIPFQELWERIRQSPAKLKIYTAEKAYAGTRESEIFNMMENGALISRDGAIWRAIEDLKG